MKYTLSAAALILLAASACKKDSSSKSPIDGNWNFTSLSANTSVTYTVNDPNGDVEKDVTTSNYTTTNNQGTISIGVGVMTAKGIGYTISTELTETYYLNGVADDPNTAPFDYTVPPTNSTSNFKIVGTDSIYSSGGVSAFGASGASGAKFTLSGNTLTMEMKLDTTMSDNSFGAPGTKRDVATQIVVLTKQ